MPTPQDPRPPYRDEPTVPRPPYPHEPTVPRPPYPHEPTVPRFPRPHEPQPPAAGQEAPPATEYRFGPGLPTSVDTGGNHTADVWRGTVRPDQHQSGSATRRRGRRRLLGGWLLPAAVLIGVLAYLGWQRYAPPLAVTGVSVRTDPGGPACDGTAIVTGTLTTNGQPGTVEYRWRRSDGTVSHTLRQAVTPGARETDVVLRWAFDGQGTLRATATLEVLSPDRTTGSAAFTYKCR